MFDKHQADVAARTFFSLRLSRLDFWVLGDVASRGRCDDWIEVSRPLWYWVHVIDPWSLLSVFTNTLQVTVRPFTQVVCLYAYKKRLFVLYRHF